MAAAAHRMPSANSLDTIAFENAAVDYQLSQYIDEMLPCEVSRVLIIYTGGTIGMKNTHEHGYIPVPNYLAETLSSQSRFHDLPSLNSVFGRLSRTNSTADLTALNNPTQNLPNTANSTVNPKALQKHLDPAMNALLRHHTTPPSHSTMNGTCSGVTLPPNTPVNKIRLPCFKHLPNSQGKIPSLITPPSLYGKRIRYSILEYDPLLDSCNMTMTDWIRIATDIEANYELYDAFIVLHGTDTMAYTASALSFMLEDLGKTVILTGSQVPITEIRNDAIDNLLGALTIAGHFVIPEVCLYFANKLFRGNRSSKLDAIDFNAFDSPNLRPLVKVGINIDVNWSEVVRPTSISRFRAHKSMNPNVASLRLFPGITASTIRTFLAPPIQGVVLETYGAGNAPSTRVDLIAALKEACDRGVVIVNCTQCKRGLVTDVYQTGKVLYDAGVVPGSDMTPECALTKLSYLLGHGLSVHKVREMMTKNLRGELTVVQPKTRFSYINKTYSLLQLFFRAASSGRLRMANGTESSASLVSAMTQADNRVAKVTASAATAASITKQVNATEVSQESAVPKTPQQQVVERMAQFDLHSEPSTSSRNSFSAEGEQPMGTEQDEEEEEEEEEEQQNPTSTSALGVGPLSNDDQRWLERSLYPLLICGAAASGDMEGLRKLWDVMDESNRSDSLAGGKRTGPGYLGGAAVTGGENNMNLSQGDWEGRSPLHIACNAGHFDIVHFLLCHGASIHVRDQLNHTPLYDAVTRGQNMDIVDLLLETGAHFNDSEVADLGWKLMIAATEGNLKLLSMIARARYDLNRPLFDQRTVLHILASEHRHECLQFLLTNYPGLDLNLRNRSGHTCVEEAAGCEECLALFRARLGDGYGREVKV